MKKLAYTIFAALLFVTASFTVQAEEQSRAVSGFNAVASGGPFEVHVKLNGTESLKISAPSSVINEIETRVEDGTLHIKFKERNYNWNDNHGKIEIWVTAKSLSGLSNAGSGNIEVEGALTGNDVHISLSGSGNIHTAVKSTDFKASIAGSGNIEMSGNASDTKINIAGSGGLNAKRFKTSSAMVSIAGSGSAYLEAEKTISARIVGSGSVVYSGSASVGESSTIGSGSISRAN
jgi:hypothetical protein